MITVQAKADLKEINALLAGLASDQVPFATAYALTQTAKAAQGEVQREIARVFDRPTRFTIGSVYVKPATKRNLVAQVKIQDTVRDSSTRPVQWLYAEVEGGNRKLKGLEVLLQAKGAMPKGWFAVPTSNAPLDAYGNVPAGRINQILSQLQARNAYNVDRNESAAQKLKRNSTRYRGRRVLSRYFAVVPGQGGKTGHLPPGVWERVNAGSFVGPLQAAHGSIRPIFLYVPSAPRYRSRLAFSRIVHDTVSTQLRFQFRRGILLARRTAK